MTNWQDVSITSAHDFVRDALATPAQPVVTARAPAKLIISGEHSVVYKQPAIALAIDYYTTAKVKINLDAKIGCDLLTLSANTMQTRASADDCRDRIDRSYAEFDQGKASIRSVIQHPKELIIYTISLFLQHLKIPANLGVNLELSSTVPIGCGLGSSAAAILSTLYALDKLFASNLSRTEILTLARKIENLQHGRSSGLDLNLIAKGGCIHYIDGVAQAMKSALFPMCIVNTGQPQATTGECVSSVAGHFADPALLTAFAQVTASIAQAMLQNNLCAIQQGIKQNHRLLQEIGVVPTKVSEFIAEVEAAGAATKICGAGSIQGDTGGIVLVVGTQDLSYLPETYAYELQTVNMDQHGVRII